MISKYSFYLPRELNYYTIFLETSIMSVFKCLLQSKFYLSFMTRCGFVILKSLVIDPDRWSSAMLYILIPMVPFHSLCCWIEVEDGQVQGQPHLTNRIYHYYTEKFKLYNFNPFLFIIVIKGVPDRTILLDCSF